MNKLVALFEKFGIIRAKRTENGFIKSLAGTLNIKTNKGGLYGL